MEAKLLVSETSLPAGFQNPDRQRAISSVSSLLSVLAQCPGRTEVSFALPQSGRDHL